MTNPVLALIGLIAAALVVRVSRSACCFLSIACVLACVPLQAIGSVLAQLTALESSSLSWSERHEMHLFGLRAVGRQFSSTETGREVAERFAKHTDIFQRVVALRNKTVLSGVESGWHWVAEIDSASFGARGLVSALRVGKLDLDKAFKAQSGPGFNWLPRQAKRRFSQRATTLDRQSIDEIYSTTLRSNELLAYLQKQLRLNGWLDEPGLAWSPNMGVWRRKASELTLVSSASPGGSLLFIHYLE